MSCSFLPGMVVCRGPRTRPELTSIQRSAGWCTACRRRRVLTLVGHWPIEPSYYGPHFTWTCSCGNAMSAPDWEVE